MKKIRKNYSLEFKIQAVSLSEQRGNVSSVAKELGIFKESLVNWRKRHKEGKFSKEKQVSSDLIVSQANKKMSYSLKPECCSMILSPKRQWKHYLMSL